ncbi:rhamnogalacturonate lyase [Phtheirospermum japonicum]|uniref:Rhamnogalacturonate lyase n=1 Tax=Phtheirospermum japonicum TaxID=374723 RepID=A0A830DBZ3_9LAMI|nr:rhamnogalacturonate lyase [Phtheirospermum japonicum]
MLRDSPGFYSYAVLERLKGWPAFDIQEGRIVFKLQENKFHYMAMSDERQRIMPMPEDRTNGKVLDYPEAVLLTRPTNVQLKGEVDDKYLYSCDNKDNKVYGWVSKDPPLGFWMITPSNEFRTGGPFKQDLTSHVGPTVLSMFISTHYAGKDIALKFQTEDYWKKVFGPIYVFLNSNVSAKTNPTILWNDAKQRMQKEEVSWPYNFPLSGDFFKSNQRGANSHSD